MHTKGKWKALPPEASCGDCIVQADDKFDTVVAAVVGGMPAKEQLANAERICKCVNGWDDLVKQRDELLTGCRVTLKGIKQNFTFLDKADYITLLEILCKGGSDAH